MEPFDGGVGRGLLGKNKISSTECQKEKDSGTLWCVAVLLVWEAVAD